jgi:predicted anti-sigma-YlaC factor YlaD
MNCEEADYLLDIHLDGELDLGRQVEVEQHLSQCLSCQLILRERQEFRTFFAAAVPRFRAPPQLRADILTTVRSPGRSVQDR